MVVPVSHGILPWQRYWEERNHDHLLFLALHQELDVAAMLFDENQGIIGGRI
jgi:hypothetical protein